MLDNKLLFENPALSVLKLVPNPVTNLVGEAISTITKTITEAENRDVSKIKKLTEGNAINIFNIFGTEVEMEPSKKTPNAEVEISNYHIDDQGDTNACGTTTLTSILNYHGEGIKNHWEIDEDIRSTRFDLYTAPGAVIDFARDKGYNAGMENNGSVEDLASYVDKGVPVMTLIDSSPSNKADTGLHWVAVVGYKRDGEGEIEKLKIADPSGGNVRDRSVDYFKKQWSDVHVGEDLPIIGERSIDTGYNNLFLVITPKDDVLTAPDGSKVNTSDIRIPNDSDTFTGRVAELIGGGARFVDDAISTGEDVVETIGDAVDTVVDGVSSTVSTITSMPSRAINGITSGIYSYLGL